MKPPFQPLAALALVAFACMAASQTPAQLPAASQPLNGSVSDYGATFIFSAPPNST